VNFNQGFDHYNKNKSFYRPDIDGLRAVAVMAVIAFHCFPDAVTGGFLGVDIFFAISGYVIASSLFKDIEKNRFCLIRF